LRTLAAFALCAALIAPTAGAQDSRIRWARLAVEGPLDGARLDCGAGGEMWLEGRLLPGERAVIEVPAPTAPTGMAVEPRVADPALSDRVAFDGWVEDPSAARLVAVPMGLRLRPRPALPEWRAGSVPRSLLLVLAGSFLLTLVLRARRLLALANACVWSAVAVLLLARTPLEGPAGIRVLEGEAGSSLWLAVDASREGFELGGERPWLVDAEPARARLSVRVPLIHPPGLPGAGARILLRGGTLLRIVGLDARNRDWKRANNHWGELEEVWLRSAGGDWTFHGSWPAGAPLPAPLPDSGEHRPPSWLDPALPQGRSILLGRLVPGAFGTVPASWAPLGTWVRLYGF
jgi:hypothetical protein